MGLISSFVLGYHGCKRDTAECFIQGTEHLAFSHNPGDWLGHGVYFWEANPQRGLDWARRRAKRDGWSPDEAAVVGAVVELGNCLDLLSEAGIEAVRLAYKSLQLSTRRSGSGMLRNSGGPDRLMRRLDCAVIERLHKIEKEAGRSFETVRGVFREGKAIYNSSGFFAKTHIQICVRSPACIKGVFRVAPDQFL